MLGGDLSGKKDFVALRMCTYLVLLHCLLSVVPWPQDMPGVRFGWLDWLYWESTGGEA